MDRPYSSKVRKSAKDNLEASEMAISRLSGQLKKRPVSSFAGNVVKKEEEVIKDKTQVSSVTKGNYDNTCAGVNSLPKIGKIPAAADQSKKSDANPTPANKKCLRPSIKAPIYPSSLLQHRITSCPVRRNSSEILAKSLSLNFPVRVSPVRTVVKPNDKKTQNSQVSPVKQSSATRKDDTKKPAVRATPPGAMAKPNDKKSQLSLAKCCSIDSKKPPSLPNHAPPRTAVKPVAKKNSQPAPNLAKCSSTTKSSQNKQSIKIKKVLFTKETPSPHESSSTITDDTMLQPQPTTESVSEENTEMTITSEEKCVPTPIVFSSAVKRICSARGRGIVNTSSKHDDSCDDDGDSVDEYEEDYESDDSSSENEGEDENQQSRAASSADDNWLSSPADAVQQLSSPFPGCVDDECQSVAFEENEIDNPWEEAPPSVGSSFSANMTASPSAAGESVKRKVPLHRRKSVFPFFSPTLNMPSTCSLQKLSRETPVHTAAPPTESAEDSTSDKDKEAALDEVREQLKVIASAASNDKPTTNDESNEQKQTVKKSEAQIYYEMICRLDYTPLKPIADELVLLHADLDLTEVCPTLNRRPSFIGVHNKDDGLLSGRSSPKLDIPLDRYRSHVIKQHPLAMYSQKMENPVIEQHNAQCSGDDDKGGVAANDAVQLNTAKLGEQESGLEESSSKGTVEGDSQYGKETEHQAAQCIADHQTESGVEESSGKTSVKGDSQDSKSAEQQSDMDYPAVAGMDKSSSKASVNQDSKETEHQTLPSILDHPMVSGVQESSSAKNDIQDSHEFEAVQNTDYPMVYDFDGSCSKTSVESDSQDGQETEREAVDYPMVYDDDDDSCSKTSAKSDSQDGQETEYEAADYPMVYDVDESSSKTSVESSSQDSQDQVVEYDPVVMEEDSSSSSSGKASSVESEKAVPQLPILKRSLSYKETCIQRRKVYLEKVKKCYSTQLKPPVQYKPRLPKKLTLPPILKQQQQTGRLIPTPPKEAPPTSGPLSAARNIRRKQYQKKSLQEAVKLVPAHLTDYMLDCPQRCIEYAENLEKVKRKQQYSESLRQKQLLTWANKKQHCTNAQP